MLQSLKGIGVTDKTIVAAWNFRREELIGTVARIIAVKKDSPGLDVAVLVAERCEWNSHLEGPAASRDLRRRLPEEVRRGVLAGCVIEDRVVLDVARGDDEQLG